MTIEEAEAECKRLLDACVKQNHEICQTLGKALGYPWFKDDLGIFPGATEADGVCVGDHVAESLAAEAAEKIAALEESVVDIARVDSKIMFDVVKQLADRDTKIAELELQIRKITAYCSHVKMGSTPDEICDNVIRAHDEIVEQRDRIAELETSNASLTEMHRRFTERIREQQVAIDKLSQRNHELESIDAAVRKFATMQG